MWRRISTILQDEVGPVQSQADAWRFTVWFFCADTWAPALSLSLFHMPPHSLSVLLHLPLSWPVPDVAACHHPIPLSRCCHPGPPRQFCRFALPSHATTHLVALWRPVEGQVGGGATRGCLVASYSLPQLTLGKCGKPQKYG